MHTLRCHWVSQPRTRSQVSSCTLQLCTCVVLAAALSIALVCNIHVSHPVRRPQHFYQSQFELWLVLGSASVFTFRSDLYNCNTVFIIYFSFWLLGRWDNSYLYLCPEIDCFSHGFLFPVWSGCFVFNELVSFFIEQDDVNKTFSVLHYFFAALSEEEKKKKRFVSLDHKM